MTALTTLLIVLEIILAVGLTVLVILQQSKEEGLSAFGVSGQSFFAKNKGMDSLLDKATKWVVAAFLVISVLFAFV